MDNNTVFMTDEPKTVRKKDDKPTSLLALFLLLFGLAMVAIGLLQYPTNPIATIGKPNNKAAAVGIAMYGADTAGSDTHEVVPESKREPADSSAQPSATNGPPLVLPTFVLYYAAGDNGHLQGTATQHVSYGGNGAAIIAIPDFGYHFAGWSDGSTANPRTDETVTSSATIGATFAINTYTLTYGVRHGGYLTGTTTQTVTYGGSGATVTAMPNIDHVFVNWSDGSTANPRTDTAVESNISVRANFIFMYVGGPTGNASGGGESPPPPLSAIATITSGTYTVSAGGTANETVTGVSFGTGKAAFLAALTKGHINQTWNDVGINDPVASNDVLVVTAQNGATTVTYTVTVDDPPPPPGGPG